jgi:WhiB family transcriptional regulator, redox-sensing transcriptional regulator
MYTTIQTDIPTAPAPSLDTISLSTSFPAGTSLDTGGEALTRETVDRVFDELVLADEQTDESTGTPVVLRTPQARCADGHGTLSQLFFSDDVVDIARAKAICSRCKLTTSCLDGALDRAEPWGVWGGELIENGRVVVHKRPRGRPPKHPRPLVVVDECPIPPHLVA